MTYGYVRVSSATQNVDRQIDDMYKQGLKDKNIYIDKQSGKNFERKSYQKLRNKLKKRDLVIIKSIDRLGRDYKMIIDEWHYITKVVEADIFVIDMPLLDTRTSPENLVGTFISDIVLQILSFVAETERENIKQRQAEGIKLAKKRGIHMGRPKYILPKEFNSISLQYINGEITSKEASKKLDMANSTFLKYSNDYKKTLNQ